MNERIKELAEQATKQATKPDGHYIVQEWQRVFAELIVRECLQQCEMVRDSASVQKNSKFLTESGKIIYEGVWGGATNCGYAIQEHFGVEL